MSGGGIWIHGAKELLELLRVKSATATSSASSDSGSSSGNGGGLDERSATGGVFCTQWLNERTAEMEQQLKDIVARAYASATAGGS